MKNGFTSATLRSSTVELIDKIRAEDPHDPSRTAIVAAAVEAYARKLGVEA